jgi:hypothetical protein
MLLLTATNTGHSPATDPNNRPIAGELLLPAEMCDNAHCLCRREFVGVTSHSRTLHAQVVDLEVTVEQLRDIARDYVREMFDDEDPDEIDAYVEDLTYPATDWAAGTVVERWGHELRDIRDDTMGAGDA